MPARSPTAWRCDFLPECHMASTQIRDRRHEESYLGSARGNGRESQQKATAQGELLPRIAPGRPGRMSRFRLTAETRGRNCELAFERPVESSFGLIAHFGCDLCHRITG